MQRFISRNECANLHLGDPQFADLGDGNSWGSELFEFRESWHYPWGSCLESVIGGNHFRAWKQNGTHADSGAWFLAASKELVRVPAPLTCAKELIAVEFRT